MQLCLCFVINLYIVISLISIPFDWLDNYFVNDNYFIVTIMVVTIIFTEMIFLIKISVQQFDFHGYKSRLVILGFISLLTILLSSFVTFLPIIIEPSITLLMMITSLNSIKPTLVVILIRIFEIIFFLIAQVI